MQWNVQNQQTSLACLEAENKKKLDSQSYALRSLSARPIASTKDWTPNTQHDHPSRFSNPRTCSTFPSARVYLLRIQAPRCVLLLHAHLRSPLRALTSRSFLPSALHHATGHVCASLAGQGGQGRREGGNRRAEGSPSGPPPPAGVPFAHRRFVAPPWPAGRISDAPRDSDGGNHWHKGWQKEEEERNRRRKRSRERRKGEGVGRKNSGERESCGGRRREATG